MVNYLDSRRIAGTTAERSSIPITATAGGWVELGRTTLGSNNTEINVTSLANKRYLMCLFDTRDGSGTNHIIGARLNGDTGSNYAHRRSSNGGADNTGTSQTYMQVASAGGNKFGVSYIANYSTKEKLMISNTSEQSTAGASTAPTRQEAVTKHAQTSNPISSILTNGIAGDSYGTGSELVVLGWDPSDTHTTNFWTELADVTASGSSSNLSSGTITAKKYLWIQVYGKSSGNFLSRLTFNNDSGANYAERQSKNGAADATSTSANFVNCGNGDDGAYHFINMFVINNSANEKLGIIHSINTPTGAAQDPNRREIAFKWANTSNQITEIDFDASTGNYDSASFLKVWGAD